jgi:hypothetical protein
LAHRGWRIPNTTTTRFALASGNKGFTALAVMSLVEEGALSLATTARSILGEDLPLIDDGVTVEHLLGHRSGIGDYLDEEAQDDITTYAMPVPVHELATTEDYLAVLGGFDTVFAPGEKLDAYAGQTYQSSELAYQAAIEGQGVAMAQLVLVEKDLAAKRLVRPLRKTLDMGTFTYYLLTPADRPESPQLKEFREWLLEQCSSG